MSAKTVSKKINTLPKEWPGAFGAFKYSKDAVLLNLGNIFILTALGSVVSGFGNNIKNRGLAFIVMLAVYLVLFFIQIATIINYFAGADNKKLELGYSIKEAQKYFVNYTIMNILRIFIVALSILALVIPFFFVLPRLLLSDYYLIDKDMGPIEALKASWNGTKGHALQVASVIGAYIAILVPILLVIYLVFLSKAFILLVIPVVIATFIALFLYGAVFTLLYRNIAAK